jgi:hypothetical protein
VENFMDREKRVNPWRDSAYDPADPAPPIPSVHFSNYIHTVDLVPYEELGDYTLSLACSIPYSIHALLSIRSIMPSNFEVLIPTRGCHLRDYGSSVIAFRNYI